MRERVDAGDRPIVLTVSAKLAHKNLIRLISALASIPAGQRPLLVLPGYPTAHEPQLREHARALGIESDVRLLGWVSGAELEALYGAATCFVFPSLAEGFGLPVLEAMARGVPVACSARGALAEVAGDAALLFNPLEESEIAQAIRRLIDDGDESARLATAGRERAAGFSWQAAAAGTLATYRRTLAAAPGRIP
jgi:glycosyltransferase involved in cell wall biosynthesis